MKQLHLEIVYQLRYEICFFISRFDWKLKT